MMKQAAHLIVGAVLCLALRAAPAFAKEPALPSSIQRAKSAVVTIRTQLIESRPANSKNNKQRKVRYERHATGVVISDSGLILTNYHTVAHAPNIYAIFSDGRLRTAKVIKSDKANDLSLLRVRHPPVTAVLALADSNRIKVNDVIYSIGHAAWPKTTISVGHVSFLQTNPQASRTSVTAIQCVLRLAKGDSGSPILTTEGKLVGLIAAREKKRPDHILVIPSSKISRLLMKK